MEEIESGSCISRLGLMQHDDWTASSENIEVGWTLDRSHWGRGLETEGATAAVAVAVEQLGLARVISIADPANLASRRVMENCGLTYQGAARWREHDVVWCGTRGLASWSIPRPVPGQPLRHLRR